MKITVFGGGNIGTQFAVHSAEKGHNVVMYTSTPEVFSKHLNIVDEDGKKLTFDKFYGTQNGEPVILTSKVLLFLRKLDAEIDPEILMEETTDASQYEASDNSNVKFSLDGGTPMSMTLIAKQVVANYSNQHLMEGAEQIRDVFNNSKCFLNIATFFC